MDRFWTWWSKPVRKGQIFADLDEYEYQRLPTPSSIRLVELLPATKGQEDDLRCTLHIIDLKDNHAEYTALSYAWGDSSPSLRIAIKCDGCKIAITPTLHSALQRVRKLKPTVFVWADALCINQGTSPEALRERGSQVTMMGSIYSKASEVLVDLGSDSQDEIIVRNLKRYAWCEESSWQAAAAVSNTKTFRSDWDTYSGNRNTLYQAFDLPQKRDSFWPLLSRFSTRPWFRRLWVIQEFALARSLRVMLGNHTVDETTLVKGVERAAEHYKYMVSLCTYQPSDAAHFLAHFLWIVVLSVAQRSTSHQSRLVQIQQMPQETLGVFNSVRALKQKELQLESNSDFSDYDVLKFHRLFFKVRIFRASDLRDRVYALLGLLSDEDVSMLYVDYTESIADVSARVSRYLIQEGFTASALNHAVGICATEGPSWAVTLSDESEDHIWRGPVNADGNCVAGIFDAGGEAKPQIHLIPNTSMLAVKAICIGPILSQSNTFVTWSGTIGVGKQLSLRNLYEFSTTWVPIIQNIIVWIEDARAMWSASNGTGIVGDEPFELACWRTMISDIYCTADGEYQRLDNLPEIYEILLELASFAAVSVDAGIQEALPVMGAFQKMPFLYHRRVALAETGPCHVPDEAELDDQIAIVLGCPLPMLLRRVEGNTYRLVGSCYVHGMMDGQALNRPEWSVQDILLV